MGLNIRIDVTPDELLERLGEHSPNERLERDVKYVQANFSDSLMNDPIDMAQSYSAIHCVRAAYARLKGWPVNERNHVEHDHMVTSHLIWHADNEGYYIPDDVVTPICTDEYSLGSSVRLLAELREIEQACATDELLWIWRNIYVAALASVVCDKVVYFR